MYALKHLFTYQHTPSASKQNYVILVVLNPRNGVASRVHRKTGEFTFQSLDK